MPGLLIREKPARVLICLKNTDVEWHLSKLARQVNVTYVFVSHLIAELEKKKLVEVGIKGKKKVVKLTEKGIIIANHLEGINEKMNVV